ncbi:MAG: hypothetical protein ABI811_17330 [Acidobacteriota bacterium]
MAATQRIGTLTLAGQTFTVTQDAAPACTFILSPASTTLSSQPGGGTVSVNSGLGCLWTAVSNSGFVSVSSGASGSGSGVVQYLVTQNTGGQRSGTITIAGQTFTVAQSAPVVCSFSLDTSSTPAPAAGGSGTVLVSAPQGCAWSSFSNSAFIALGNNSSGSGDGFVEYTVANNAAGQSRTGTLTIAGKTFTVIQDAACTFSLGLTTASMPVAGGSGTVAVNAPAGCAWSAVSNSAFITLVQGTVGSGNGIVEYSVASSPLAQARTGTLTIAGRTFTLTQSAAANPQPAKIRLLSGSGQTGPPGTSLANPIIFVVEDSNGTPVGGANVAFAGTNATVNPVSAVSTAAGQVETRATLGANPGAATIAAAVNGLTATASATVTAPPSNITITSIVNGASFLPDLTPQSWISIRGTALATTTRAWRTSDFIGDRLPISLDGVSVRIAGIDAPVYFVSPAQLNVLLPSSIPPGPVTVVVTTPSGSAQATVNVRRTGPAFFTFEPEGGRYLAAVHLNGNLAGKTALFGASATTLPFQVGETAMLFGTGFGDTNPRIATDRIYSGAAPLIDPLVLRIGGVQAAVQFAGLVAGGLYQFNVTIPSLPPGEHQVVAEIGGVSSPVGVFLAVGSTSTQTLSSSRASLVFRSQAQSQPAPQSFQLTTNSSFLPLAISTATAKGGDWLQATLSSSITPSIVTASVNAAGLVPDSYTGTIRITSVFASNNPLLIPVLLTVSASTPASYTISTFAGTANVGATGDGGPATSATMNLPFAVTVDSDKNLYFGDFLTNLVRKINPSGTISTIAGNGNFGSSGDGGQAKSAMLAQPAGVLAAPDGAIYIAEYSHRIRKVTPDGVIRTIAGNGQAGNSGDGGKAADALLNLPTALAMDDLGNLYISESGSGRIRKISPDSTISTIASGLDRPDGVAVDSAGNVFVAEFSQVTKIAPGGQASVIFTKLRPAVAVDITGNVYVSDYNTGQIIRNPGPQQVIIAGTGVGGFSGDGGAATLAQLAGIRSLAFFPDGSIVAQDAVNHRLRKLTPGVASVNVTVSPGSMTFNYQVGGATPAAQSLTIATTGASTGFSITPSTTSGGNWLEVSPATGVTPASVPVSVKVAGLLPGTYSGQLVVTPANGIARIVTVTLIVSAPTITASQSTVALTASVGDTTPKTANVSITSTAGVLQFSVEASAQSGGNWLSVSPLSGSTAATITLSANPSGLAAGTYTGRIIITAPAAANGPLNVPVTITITPPASISVSPPSLSFTASAGATAAQTGTISVTSSGANMPFSAAPSTQSGGNWISSSTSTSNTPGTVGVTINPTGLGVGTYTGQITITAPSAINGPVDVPVTLTINPPTGTNIGSLSFQYQIGGPLPGAKLYSLTSSGGPLSFTTSTTASWLQVSPFSGVTPSTLTVTVNPAGLVPGIYSGHVVVTAPQAANSPLLIAITFGVTAQGAAPIPPIPTLRMSSGGADGTATNPDIPSIRAVEMPPDDQ